MQPVRRKRQQFSAVVLAAPRSTADCFRTQERRVLKTAAATADADTEITVEDDTVSFQKKEVFCNCHSRLTLLRRLTVSQMEKMERSLESVTKNFATLRTGRANPAMLDRVKVKPRPNFCIDQRFAFA